MSACADQKISSVPIVPRTYACYRNVSVNNLIYVKEDYMIPHSFTFHDLIKKKAGPLADFGAHEDIRAHSDSRMANTETHAGAMSPTLFAE